MAGKGSGAYPEAIPQDRLSESEVHVLPSVRFVLLLAVLPAWAYPPGTGILSKSRSCVACHTSLGPWSDEARTVIDVLDAKTKASLWDPHGFFRIEVPRHEARTVLTVIGRKKGEASPPLRNGWIYVDPKQIPTSSLNKFAPGWDVNVPLACRVVGDSLEGREGDHLTVLPMTLRPGDAARDAELELQVLLSRGESVKGRAKEGLISNYFMRKVLLKVLDP